MASWKSEAIDGLCQDPMFMTQEHGYGPLAVKMQENIISSWKLCFVSPLALEQVETPSIVTEEMRLPISQCAKCKHIVDAVKWIYDKCESNFSGSSLGKFLIGVAKTEGWGFKGVL
jgi:hypothetical protein